MIINNNILLIIIIIDATFEIRKKRENEKMFSFLIHTRYEIKFI